VIHEGKLEIRSTKSETNSNVPNPKFETGPSPAPAFGASNFGFVSDFEFGASDFFMIEVAQ
jgi:hypothetical protein